MLLILDHQTTSPDWNLAAEEYLLTRFTDSVFRLWRNAPSIIVGRHQNSWEEVNVPYIRQHHIPVIRRLSGGGAVFHDLGNINYSFIVLDAGDFDFSFFTGPIIRALRALGVDAGPSGRNDISIGEEKISGGAQFRSGGVTLHHGTLLFDADLDVLSRALRPSEDKFQSKAIKSIRSRVCNIKPHLKEPLPVIEFQERIVSGIEGLEPLALNVLALEEAERLALGKYSAWEWNYGESPRFSERKKMRFPWGGVEALLLIDEGRIAECSFYGDYFGSGDYAPLLSRLMGVQYTKKRIANALAGFDTSNIFTGSMSEDIAALLTSSIE